MLVHAHYPAWGFPLPTHTKMDQGEPNSSILTTNNSCGSLGNTKLQAQFLESHSQILSLENEIDILRVRLSEEKIKKGSFYVTEAKDNQLLERCHKVG